VVTSARGRVSDAVRAAFACAAARLDDNEPAIRAARDPEAVHQARVATRRLRSDLRTLHDFLDPDWAQHLRAELRWLGAELGGVRDIEVLGERLTGHANLLPESDADAARAVIRRLDSDEAVARTDLLLALRSARYAQLQGALHDAATKPRLAPAARRSARKALPDAVRPTWRRLRRAVKELPKAPSDAALHEVRIRAKRCRYACELASPAVGHRARDLADAVTQLQDVLGAHQDAVVARAWLAKAALECDAAEAYALGMLAEIERARALDARAAFPKAWRAARRPALRSWL
jgi:CHAD domain-containing protein